MFAHEIVCMVMSSSGLTSLGACASLFCMSGCCDLHVTTACCEDRECSIDV